MKGLRFRSVAVILFFSSANLYINAQVTAIGQWRSHFAYKQGIAVTQGNGILYCATQGGAFSYNPADNSFSLLSTVNGFSDIQASALNFDPVTNTLLIAYNDANIDIVQGSAVYNLPDIMNATASYNKIINNVYFRSPLAYLACGFGIVVVDVLKHQTNDTYFIGPLGTAVNVRDVNSDGTYLYAATDLGLFRAPLSSSNLDDYSNWTLQNPNHLSDSVPSGTGQVFNSLAFYNSKMYANNARHISNNSNTDSVWEFTAGAWINTHKIGGDKFSRLRVSNNTLVGVGQNSLDLYNYSDSLESKNFSTYGFAYAQLADGILNSDGTAWLADQNWGFLKAFANNTAEVLVPNGPRTKNVFNMASSNNVVWSVPGGVGMPTWKNSAGNTDGISVFANNSWSTIFGSQPGGNMDTLPDLVALAIDPKNSSHAFASSLLHGLLEFNNGQLVKDYNPTNSSINSQTVVGPFWDVGVSGLAYDTLGNLFVGNSLNNSLLSVRKANGSWVGLDFSCCAGKNSVGPVMCTSINQTWAIFPPLNQILVYNNNGQFALPTSANAKVLSASVGSGNLTGTVQICMAEDKNGAIWLGTDNGIVVIYNPSNIFNNANYDAQPVYVQQNGYTQLLFQAEEVTALVVDGANRKWVGTNTAGAFLMSADGTQQIYHFTTANSPLVSNSISCITINGSSGEVFFGTPNGIVSFKSTATEGTTAFGQVYAYPNPVKHEYTGVIAIKNLSTNSDVRITDITGTLIFKTTALGGQAIWDGTNFSGERAHTGVYMVFCTSADGTSTCVTKILFIN